MSPDVKLNFRARIADPRSRLKTIFAAFVPLLVQVILFPAKPMEQIRHLDQYPTLQFLNNTGIASFLHQIHDYILPPGWSLIAATEIGESVEVCFVVAIILTLALKPVIAYETCKFVDSALINEVTTQRVGLEIVVCGANGPNWLRERGTYLYSWIQIFFCFP